MAMQRAPQPMPRHQTHPASPRRQTLAPVQPYPIWRSAGPSALLRQAAFSGAHQISALLAPQSARKPDGFEYYTSHSPAPLPQTGNTVHVQRVHRGYVHPATALIAQAPTPAPNSKFQLGARAGMRSTSAGRLPVQSILSCRSASDKYYCGARPAALRSSRRSRDTLSYIVDGARQESTLLLQPRMCSVDRWSRTVRRARRMQCGQKADAPCT